VVKLKDTQWENLAKLQAGIVTCPHLTACRSECPKLVRDERPIPDFIGVDYAGLVIIATNPGTKKAGKSNHDSERRSLADDLAKKPSIHRLKNLSKALDPIMLNWQSTLTNQKWRNELSLPVPRLAAINLIKCRTTAPDNDPFSMSKSVAHRCFETHTKPLLAILNPTHVIGQWKGAANALPRLWPDRFPAAPPSFNGKRDLRDGQKTTAILPVIDAFNVAPK